jgi:hypothetical protein
MRPAKGSRIAANPRQIPYLARFEPNEFEIVADYSAGRPVSFNWALREIVRQAGKAIVTEKTEPA